MTEREEPEWVPDRREVAPELVPGYQHETYPPQPVRFAPWVEQLESATKDKLHLYLAGGTGEINWRHTELAGE